MRVLWINNDGGGFADHVTVADGMTVAQFFAERLPYGNPADYLVRCNRLPCSADQVLQDGDRLSCTPIKIQGAAK